MDKKKIILLAGKGNTTAIVFNAINNEFGVHQVIQEEEEEIKLFLKRRIKKLGLWTVIGQLVFQTIVAKLLGKLSGKRIAEILKSNDLDITEIPPDKKVLVSSINSDQSLKLLKEAAPDLIIVNGTRIISKKVLQSVSCKFINTHAGITPKYRGVHGFYWALANDDPDNGGVTVHFVDAGIDTGSIILQSKVSYTEKDNFTTYPILQLAEGVKLLKKVVNDYFSGSLMEKKPSGDSRLWYHPTIWQYLYYRLIKKIK